LSADRRILVCLALSLIAHLGLTRVARHLPARAAPPARPTVAIRVLSAPPPPPELSPPAPEAAPPEVTPPPPQPAVAKKIPRPARAQRATETPPPVAANPPPEAAPAVAPSPAPGPPVFGVSMDSTSEAGSGPAMPIGTPGGRGAARGGQGAAPTEGPGKHEGGGPPVPVYEVTEMPLPRRRCTGKYTDEAMQAGVEGTVVLELVIGADGRVRDVRVVHGLGHGLDEAAIVAMKACPFSPGRRGSEAVPVRIPEFKVHFFQAESQP